jgi:4Fe-4S single cluster domain
MSQQSSRAFDAVQNCTARRASARKSLVVGFNARVMGFSLHRLAYPPGHSVAISFRPSRSSTCKTYLQEPLFRNPWPFPGARLLSGPPVEAPLDGVLLSRIPRPFRRIPDLSCLLVAGRHPFELFRTPAAELPTLSTAANSSSLVTLSARVQAFSSSGCCTLIFERSGCSFMVRFSISESTDRSRFDMSDEVAERALDIAFESHSARIKIEFQGGEPLLNFPLIKKIVANAHERSATTKKAVDFVIASNLALLSHEILAFCKSNKILLSTSLDGPADLHNKNRPRPGGNQRGRGSLTS